METEYEVELLIIQLTENQIGNDFIITYLYHYLH